MQNSIKDKIYNAVWESILNFEYEPNQIINEKALTERYECSKAPVREALISLCNNGILRNVPRCGYEIIRITQEDVSNMLQFRYLLEGGMLACFIQNISELQIQKLELLDQPCYEVSDNVWEHFDANINFHLQLIRCSGNTYAYTQLQKTLDKLKMAYAQFYWGRWENMAPLPVTKYHPFILEGLRTRDLHAARENLRFDLQHFGPLQYQIPEFFIECADGEKFLPQNGEVINIW